MVALSWDKVGERFYDTGVDRGVFYPSSGAPEAWNGLVSVVAKSVGGEQKPFYLDGQKRLDFIQNEDFQAVVEAYAAPEGFRSCDGVKSLAPGLYATQQPRTRFGFSYRTLKGNDTKQSDYGYKLHLVYNATASPTERTNTTLSQTADLATLKWTLDTVPPGATTYRPSAHLVFDSILMNPIKLAALETIFYGTVSTSPFLPPQSDIIAYILAP